MKVGIEVRDTIGVIRERILWEGTAYTNTFEETNNKNKFHYGWSVFKIGGGSYNISLEIMEQKESAQKRIRLATVSFKPSKKRQQLTAPIFGEPIASQGRDILELYVFSGNVSFGKQDARALVLLPDTDETMYEYIIQQEPYNSRDIRWWQVSDVRGTAYSSPTRFPRISELATTAEPYLEIKEEPDNEIPIALLEIDVPVTSMVPGNYSLKLIREGASDTLNMPFRIVWEMMPLSLRNIDYAMALMKFILTEDQIDSLDEGNNAERRTRLMNWWRGEDPTPTTTFNERMAEYFRRIDQAFFAFGTIQEPDGADTERGKVYTLYGPPSEIKKDLPLDGEPLEIWIYRNRVNRVITFGIDDSGVYRLRNVESLQAEAQAEDQPDDQP